MKRIVALITCMIMLSSFSAFAAGNTRTSGLYTYEFKGNGTLRIVDFNWEASQGDIYIPSMIDGYEVAIIGERAFALNDDERYKYNDVLVTLPNTITNIEDFAFFNAPITAINIPLKTQAIGVGALLVKPQSGHVNINVFSGHEKYATIDGNLYNKQNRELLATADTIYAIITIPDGVRSIAGYVFKNRQVEIKMPETVNSIGAYAFSGAKTPDRYPKRDDQFSKHITSLGEYAFANTNCVLKNDGLDAILHSLSIIPSHAFYNIKPKDRPTKIVIPGNISHIGDYSFADIDSFLKITIKKGVKSLGSSAFEITQSFVKESQFDNRHNSIELTIEDGLQEIGENCFRGQTIENTIWGENNKEMLIILGSVNKIGNSAFENVRLTNNQPFTIDLKEGVEVIGDNCFNGFKSITIIVPSTVTRIGRDAFDTATVTLVVNQGSYAEAYAIENGITYKYPESAEDLSWLTDP